MGYGIEEWRRRGFEFLSLGKGEKGATELVGRAGTVFGGGEEGIFELGGSSESSAEQLPPTCGATHAGRAASPQPPGEHLPLPWQAPSLAPFPLLQACDPGELQAVVHCSHATRDRKAGGKAGQKGPKVRTAR